MTEELDTIYIELVVHAVLGIGNEIYMQGDIEIRIGNTKPYGESDIVIVDALLESMKKDGEYSVFSCCCGSTECAGWDKGILVSHHGETVKWYDPNSDRIWHFSKEKMIQDIKELREEVALFKKYFKRKDIAYVGVGYNW